MKLKQKGLVREEIKICWEGGGDFFQVGGGGDEQIFGWWGDFPHPTPSRENPGKCSHKFSHFSNNNIKTLANKFSNQTKFLSEY